VLVASNLFVRRVALAAFSALWLLHTPAFSQTVDLTKLLAFGAAAIGNKDYPRAIEIYSKGLENEQALTNEQRSALLRARAFAYWFSKDLPRAEEDLTAAVKLGVSLDQAYFDRAEIYLHEDRLDQALSDFEAGAKLFPNNARFPYGQGRVFAARREFARSIGYYSEAIRLDPKNNEYWLWRAESYNRAGQHREAIEEYDRALALGRFSARLAAQLHNGRGHANLRMGNYKAAIADFDLSIERYPDSPMALRWRGFAFEKGGDVARARKDYERVLSLRSDDKWTAERIRQLDKQ
jgi:tetratricopeptide (TPR) repeat protein